MYISIIKHDTFTNKGKINNLKSLWSYYSILLNEFIKNMSFNLVKGNGVDKFTSEAARKPHP